MNFSGSAFSALVCSRRELEGIEREPKMDSGKSCGAEEK